MSAMELIDIVILNTMVGLTILSLSADGATLVTYRGCLADISKVREITTLEGLENPTQREVNRVRQLQQSLQGGLEIAIATISGMTVQVCVLKCFRASYEYAALQKSDRCFCGHKLRGMVQISSYFCFERCGGNCRQRCGGKLALSVFQTGGKQPESLNKVSQGSGGKNGNPIWPAGQAFEQEEYRPLTASQNAALAEVAARQTTEPEIIRPKKNQTIVDQDKAATADVPLPDQSVVKVVAAVVACCVLLGMGIAVNVYHGWKQVKKNDKSTDPEQLEAAGGKDSDRKLKKRMKRKKRSRSKRKKREDVNMSANNDFLWQDIDSTNNDFLWQDIDSANNDFLWQDIDSADSDTSETLLLSRLS